MEINRKQNLASNKVAQNESATKKDASFYYLRAIKHFEAGENPEAEKDFNQAVSIGTEDSVAYFNRGTFYLKQKNYKAAIDDFLKAVKLNVKFSDAYYNLACCYVQILSFREGINCLKKAVKHDKEFAKIASKDPDFTNVNKMKEFQEALIVV